MEMKCLPVFGTISLKKTKLGTVVGPAFPMAGAPTLVAVVLPPDATALRKIHQWLVSKIYKIYRETYLFHDLCVVGA